MLTTHRICSLLLVVGLLSSGCGGQVSVPMTPTPTPMPEPEVTVCGQGCDFTLIQAAIDSPGTQPGIVIGVKDPVHTEAGIRVNRDVVIQGQGAGATIVQAQPSADVKRDRVFEVPAGVTATIRGMTIRHGNPRRDPFTGGGILNYGTLLLEDVIVRDNYGSAGGGLYNEGELTVVNSTITNNGSIGGGIGGLECSNGGGSTPPHPKEGCGEINIVETGLLFPARIMTSQCIL